MKRGAIQGRALTALLMVLGFVVVSVSGIVLFIAPSGRAARQMDWHMLALDRWGWSDLHIVFGFAFIAIGLLHLWLNRKPLAGYLRQRAETKESRAIRWEIVVAILLTLALFWGTVHRVVPASYLLDSREIFRQSPNGQGQ
jgi:hypothetical protein